jgi:hypothetical protein
MIEFDDKNWVQLEKDLKTFREKAIPYAVAAYLNEMAFDTAANGRKIIQGRMILRNKYTLSSVRVNKATMSKNISQMKSAAGSTAGYMEKQEFGGNVGGKSGHSKPIPTTFASGEGSAGIRRKMPKKQNKMSNISLARKTVRATSKKQANFIRVQMAMKSGDKFVYIDTGRKKFIARINVVNLSKNGASFKGASLRMVYDLTRRKISLRKNKWLEPATDQAVKNRDAIYAKALQYQINRQKIFQINKM